MELLTGIFLFYIIITLYFSITILMIWFRNKDNYFEDNLPDHTPSLTVIIPAYNEEDTIGQTIDAVLACKYPKENLEVIVVSDGSTDGTDEIVKKYSNVILLTKSNTGKADSVNQAIEKAKGELVVIIDADSFPDPDSLMKMSRHFVDKKIGAVTGTILVRNKKSLLEKCQAFEYVLITWSRRLLDFVDSVFVTPGALSMYRKTAIQHIGGFDKSLLTEDIEIAWNLLRHHYKVKMETLAFGVTNVPQTYKAWWRQRIRWDVGGFQTFWKHKKSLFSTNYAMFGVFVIPFFLLHILVSLSGFAVVVGVVLSKVYNWLLYASYSLGVGEGAFREINVNLLPNILVLFGIFLAILFIITIIFSLKTLKRAKIKIDFAFIIYALFYLAVFPILLIISLYYWARGYSKW